MTDERKPDPDLGAIDAAMARKPIDDGGPAFPTRWPRSDDAQYWTQDGMTLRQYYAGRALSAFGGKAWPTPTDSADIARTCRSIADALIAELKR
jgi:hypothetical protein